MTQLIRGFPHSIQANSGIVSSNRLLQPPYASFPIYTQVIHHPTIRRYVVRVTDSIAKQIINKQINIQTDGWRKKIRNKDLHNLHPSPNFISKITDFLDIIHRPLYNITGSSGKS
jgi:hypothetical protein